MPVLAFSSDSNGINWEYYNNQAVFLAPTLTGADGTELMRDPMIEFDSTNNKFNFVWTISWVGTTSAGIPARILLTGARKSRSM